jgi:hypothetical protein
MKNLIILSLGLATAASAFARPTDGPFTQSFGLTTTTITNTFVFPKFDTANGTKTLTSIDFTLGGQVFGTAKGESQDAGASVLTLTLEAKLTLARPGFSGNILVSIPTIDSTFNATAFDGVNDFGGTSGVTFNQVASTTSADTQSLTGSADLALFTGSGTAGTISLPIIAKGQSSGSGPGSFLQQFTTQASANASVSYNYTTSGVPEPKVYGAIGAVACLGLLGYRRYRSQQA